MSMANCLQGQQTNGGANGVFGSMNISLNVGGSQTYGGGSSTMGGGSAPTSGSGSSVGGSSPSGTQNGPGFNLGAATDQLAQTGLGMLSNTVPVWTSSLLGQQSQNQLNAPTYSGLGTQPGLTSGAGPVLPGPQPAGGVPVPTTFSTKTLLIIAGVALAAYFLFME
jgi:hypothetical protein